MNIIALDLSLTAAGWATADDCGTLSPPKESNRGMARLDWMRTKILELAAAPRNKVDLVAIEGFAFAVKSQAGIYEIGGLGYVIRLALWDRNIPFVEVPPTSLKKFATNKGNADKNTMLGEAIRQLGYAGNSHNEADARWLYTMAQAHYRPAALPLYRVVALEGVPWPKMAMTPA